MFGQGSYASNGASNGASMDEPFNMPFNTQNGGNIYYSADAKQRNAAASTNIDDLLQYKTPTYYGDDALTAQMLDNGKRDKRAMTTRALWDKNSFKPYIEQELREHEASVWWESDALDTQM
jgi:hypothetical protein